MNFRNKIQQSISGNHLPQAVMLCCFCILLNLGGSWLAGVLPIPFYLDSTGTILASVLGGYIPGVVTGFTTNLIIGITDHPSLYYGELNVIIAIAAAWFAEHHYFRRIRHLLLLSLILAAVGGGLGSILTFLLYGMDFGEGVSSPFAHMIYEALIPSVFLAQLCGDFLVDLADKVVCVFAVAAFLRFLSPRFRDQFYLYGWCQKPLPSQKRTAAQGSFSRKISLRARLFLLLSAATLLIAVVVAGISVYLYHNSILEEQSDLAKGVTYVVSSYLDPARVDEYIEKGKEAEGYEAITKHLTDLMESTTDIEYVYVYRMIEEGCQVVFDPDTADLKGEAPGTIIPFDNAFEPFLDRLLAGEEIEPVISNESYGWLLTVYTPVLDDNGVCQCYAAADISMDHLLTYEKVFITRIISLFSGFFLLILVFGMWLAKYRIILPINSMAIAANAFAYESERSRSESLELIQNLSISTGDEIENLYHTLIKTTEDTVHFIAQAQEKNDTINRLQNGLILVLADLVESRDQCTGDHVKNTAAYVNIILQQMKKDGIYSDQLSDEFIYDVVNSAPLHDVGKIHVPDALLNKPGKLTVEEFAIMKEHARVGGEIISKAIGVVSDGETSYLKEAGNLATYHHERWDGTGYPEGLSGSAIPLSARIMAVADVFDALVSERSYKKGLPFEKAISIIEEGSGSHFDPRIVSAFLKAKESIRAVACAHGTSADSM